MNEFTRMWADLSPVGRSASSGGYRRYAWTREDHELREWFVAECTRRGLEVVTDRVGNQWAWWGDPDGAVAAGRPGVVAGSHLDSVPDGGAFDGPLGVVSALAAIDELRRRGHEPDCPLGVVNFVDEEGARFGVACAGSRLLTGVLDPDRARALVDDEGRTMASAMTVAGHDPRHIGRDDAVLARIGTFVELHVEQGRHLVDLDAPVGVGTDIWPHGRWRIDLEGEANHAGTTRLEDRFDAMLGVAAVTIAARRAAEEHGCVATVGKVQLTPNGVNAIPSHAAAWLDARGPDAGAVAATVAEVREVAEEFDGFVREESWTPTTRFDPVLAERLSARLGRAPMLGTGAGHDAGILATAGISTAMLFVRNPTGISHSPEEYAEEADCLVGVSALADVLADLTTGDHR